MKIRQGTIEDVDMIASIEALCFPKTQAASKEQITKRLKAYPECFWILEDSNTIISFINGMASDEEHLLDEMYEDTSLHNADGKWQMLFSVSTHPSYQHKGYASILMRAVIDDCSKRDKLGIVLTCLEELIPFYEQFGFRNEGLSSSTHGDVAWYQMRLNLSSCKDN